MINIFESYVYIWKSWNSNIFSHYLMISDIPGSIRTGYSALRSTKNDPKPPPSRLQPRRIDSSGQRMVLEPQAPPDRLLSSTPGSAGASRSSTLHRRPQAARQLQVPHPRSLLRLQEFPGLQRAIYLWFFGFPGLRSPIYLWFFAMLIFEGDVLVRLLISECNALVRWLRGLLSRSLRSQSRSRCRAPDWPP